MGEHLGLVGLIGPSPMVVIVFEVLLNASSMFNHSNLGIPKRIDQLLRYVVVTPDMHRVHHSTNLHELNRNFGFNLPWWDRILGTYLDQPYDGMFDAIEPRKMMSMEDAKPFDCRRNARRHLRETKGMDYQATTQSCREHRAT